MKIILTTATNIILICLLVLMSSDARGQVQEAYPEGENKFTAGVGVSNFFFTQGYELYVGMNRKIEERRILDLRLMVGRLARLTYYGATAGLLMGQNRRFLEINGGYIYRPDPSSNSANSDPEYIPYLHLGHRRVMEGITLRVGVGYPNLLYVSISI